MLKIVLVPTPIGLSTQAFEVIRDQQHLLHVGVLLDTTFPALQTYANIVRTDVGDVAITSIANWSMVVNNKHTPSKFRQDLTALFKAHHIW